MTDRYAIIGNPVAHSKSPEIQASFAHATRQVLVYERLLAPRDGFRATVDSFRANGGLGANVTLPFKVEAFDYAQELTARAQQAGAVNTLKFDGTKIIGDNTDGIGLCRDIVDNLKFSLTDSRVLLMGAGGAARGVIGPLLAARPECVVVANRTQAKADEIVHQFENLGPVQAIGLAALAAQQFDIVINATSASIGGDMLAIPASCFRKGALAYEMMYGKGMTPFMTLAASAGAQTADGLGMLVEQAAEAFFVWRGIRPETAGIMTQIRKQLRGE